MDDDIPLHKEIQAYIESVTTQYDMAPPTRRSFDFPDDSCPGCGRRSNDARDHAEGCPYWGATLEDIYE